jgi:hypothetical protein
MGPDPVIFVIDLQDANKILKKKVFLLITFTSFFKDIGPKEVTKQYLGIKVCPTIFA